jgi:hypothetical protein
MILLIDNNNINQEYSGFVLKNHNVCRDDGDIDYFALIMCNVSP